MSSGTTIGTAIAVGVAGAAASAGVNAIAGAISGGPGGGTVASSGGGGGGLNTTQSQYAYYGPHPSTNPMSGEQAPKPTQMTAPKATVERSATAGDLNKTPTHAVGEGQANEDFHSIWADRLNRYLDYNTRQLG